MYTLKREVLSEDESDITLSYLSDICINNPRDLDLTNRMALKYSYTLAKGIGSNTYVYPKAVFKGDKQIYPPISLTTLSNLNQTTNNELVWLDKIYMKTENTYNMLGIKSYIPAKLFTITYGTSRTSSPSSYVTKQIPSFTPEQNNNNQYAYMIGLSVIIKDPLLPHLPAYDLTTFESTSGIPTNAAWHFEINTNSVTSNLKSFYDTTAFPLCYNLDIVNIGNGKRILRRQFNLGEKLKLKTTKYTTTTQNYSYYKYNYYYNGQKVTNTNDIFYLSPKIGTQANPNCISSSIPQGNYGNNSWVTIEGNYSGNIFTSVKNKAKLLFNIFLIKVQGNEHMNSWGWEMKKHNSINVSVNTTYYWYQLCDINVSAQNNFFGYIVNVNPNYIANTVNIEGLTNNPIYQTKLSCTYNENNNAINLPNISLSPTPAGNLRSSCYYYVSYNDAKLMSDINNIQIIGGNSPNLSGLKKINIDITMETNSTYKHTANVSSNMINSYAYCYLAADIIRETNEGSVIYTRRVISPSYLCIRAERVTGTLPSSTYYVTEYVDSF